MTDMVWAVVFSNYVPCEVDSLWFVEADAHSRAAELGGMWTVVLFVISGKQPAVTLEEMRAHRRVLDEVVMADETSESVADAIDGVWAEAVEADRLRGEVERLRAWEQSARAQLEDAARLMEDEGEDPRDIRALLESDEEKAARFKKEARENAEARQAAVSILPLAPGSSAHEIGCPCGQARICTFAEMAERRWEYECLNCARVYAIVTWSEGA